VKFAELAISVHALAWDWALFFVLFFFILLGLGLDVGVLA
jgi:hypothetical protein